MSCCELSGEQLTAVRKELPINSRYESKYKFRAIPRLILSSMRFVVLNFVVLVSSARVLEWFDHLPPKILPYASDTPLQST